MRLADKRRSAAAALAIAALALLAAVAPPTARAAAESVHGQLIVGFKKKISSKRQQHVLEALGARVHRQLSRIRAAAVGHGPVLR